MRVIYFLAMLIAFAFMIGLTVVLFVEETLYGFGGVIGMVGFVIAYSISEEMTIAPADFWFQSDWDIFKTKMGYAFSTFILTSLIAGAVLRVIFD